MTTQIQIKREVDQVKQAVNPKPPKDIWLAWHFGSDDEPHGKYGFRRIGMSTGEMQPVAEIDEIAELKRWYEQDCPKRLSGNVTRLLKSS